MFSKQSEIIHPAFALLSPKGWPSLAPDKDGGERQASYAWTAKFMPAAKREILKPQQPFWEPIHARRHEKEICAGRFCYFLTWPWQYLLGYLYFLPKKCQMREEVCTPGEFNLTIPLEARERERLLQERTEPRNGNWGGGGRVKKQTLGRNSFMAFSKITFHRRDSDNYVVQRLGVWEYSRLGFAFVYLALKRKLHQPLCLPRLWWPIWLGCSTAEISKHS